MIGTNTAGRKWIKYKIKKAWNDGKGVMGIYIHNLKDKEGNQSPKGRNSFDDFTINGVKLSKIVKAYDPSYSTSTYVYDYIKENIADWIEEAIKIRMVFRFSLLNLRHLIVISSRPMMRI